MNTCFRRILETKFTEIWTKENCDCVTLSSANKIRLLICLGNTSRNEKLDVKGRYNPTGKIKCGGPNNT